MVHTDMVKHGYHLPLHAVVNLLQDVSSRTGRQFDGVVAEYSKECDYHRRTDLRLLTLVSSRRSLQCDSMLMPADKLVDELVQHLRDKDLTLSLLRVLAVSSGPRLILYLRSADASKVHELITQLEKTGGMLKEESPQDCDLASICLAHVRLSLRPVVPGATAKVGLTELSAMLKDIERVGDHGHMSNRKLVLGADGTLQYKHAKRTLSWPFDPIQHTIAVLCAVHGILSHFLSDDLFVDSYYSAAMISDILIRARVAQRICWRTFRNLKKDFSRFERDFDDDHQFARLEAIALAQLAQFERICRRHAIAVRLAIGAIEQIRMLGRIGAETNLVESLSWYLKNQGVVVPIFNQASGSRSIPEREPCLALRAACVEDTMSKAISVLESNSVFPVGWGIRTSMYVQAKVFIPEVRAAAFIIAVRMGAVAEVRRFFHLSKYEESNENAENIKNVRAATAKCLGAPGTIAWANAIAAVSQSAVFWIDKDKYNSVKAGFRKLLRASVGFDSHFSAMERLFMNHVRVGLSYHAKAVHRNQYAAVADLTEEATSDIIDRMIVATDRGLLPAVTVQHFRDAAFAIGEDEVMVSLMVDDGGTLQLTSLAAQSYLHETPDWGVIDQDWNKLLKSFATETSKQIHDHVEHPEVCTLAIPKPLVDLCRGVLRSALALNPNARRIMIHADAMWNVVPWQFILHQHLENEIGLLLEGLIQRRRRREVHREFGKVVFWRVPGVRLGQHDFKVQLADRNFAMETSDITFWKIIDDKLKKNRICPGKGLLSILAHGNIGGERVRFWVNGEPVSNFQLTKFGEFPLVIMHVCHGATVGNLHKADDASSAPAELIQGGAWVVIAPGLPMPTSQIEKLEQYFYDLPFVSDDLNDIELRYLSACIESPLVALYTLFSGAIAPRLERITA